MKARTVRHFSNSHKPNREIEIIRELLDQHGIPRMCDDETANMTTSDRVKAALLMLRRANGEVLQLRGGKETQPVNMAEVQFRA